MPAILSSENQRALVLALACVVATVSPGCKKSESNAAFVKNNIVLEVPTIQNRIDVRIGDGVVYLGNDLDAKRAPAGGSVTITHYWQVTDDSQVTDGGGDSLNGWKVFTHLVGAGDEWSGADQTPMRSAHPPPKWRAGQIVIDRQVLHIDPGWGSPSMAVAVGLFRGNERMALDTKRGTELGNADSVGRLIVAKVEVAQKQTSYEVRKTRDSISLDGVGNEDAWTNASWSPTFTTAKGGKDPVGSARARLLWDESNLYALIEVEDTDIHSPFPNRDDTLWKADVVELFIDADKNRRGYVELQVNPNNAVFDAFFPRTRAQPHHFEWNSSLRSAVSVDGTTDRRSDLDRRWTTEIAIPHRDVLGMAAEMKVSIPPMLGDSWRLNVIRVDLAKGAKSITASSWNPITIRDFHALGRMLTVVFVDEHGNRKTAARTDAGPTTDAAP